jgi:hypothetical protein
VEDVSAAVKFLTSEENDNNLTFAVRAGGHMWWADSNNAPGGITIDLHGLNSIKLSADKSSVSVGFGATWEAVYETLDPIGLSVAGGRVAKTTGSPICVALTVLISCHKHDLLADRLILHHQLHDRNINFFFLPRL